MPVDEGTGARPQRRRKKPPPNQARTFGAAVGLFTPPALIPPPRAPVVGERDKVPVPFPITATPQQARKTREKRQSAKQHQREADALIAPISPPARIRVRRGETATERKARTGTVPISREQALKQARERYKEQKVGVLDILDAVSTSLGRVFTPPVPVIRGGRVVGTQSPTEGLEMAAEELAVAGVEPLENVLEPVVDALNRGLGFGTKIFTPPRIGPGGQVVEREPEQAGLIPDDVARNLATGLAQTIAGAPAGAMVLLQNPSQVWRETKKQYASFYGPLFRGDFEAFQRNMEEQPVQILFDVWAGLSLGLGAAVRSAALGRTVRATPEQLAGLRQGEAIIRAILFRQHPYAVETPDGPMEVFGRKPTIRREEFKSAAGETATVQRMVPQSAAATKISDILQSIRAAGGGRSRRGEKLVREEFEQRGARSRAELATFARRINAYSPSMLDSAARLLGLTGTGRKGRTARRLETSRVEAARGLAMALDRAGIHGGALPDVIEKVAIEIEQRQNRFIEPGGGGELQARRIRDLVLAGRLLQEYSANPDSPDSVRFMADLDATRQLAQQTEARLIDAGMLNADTAQNMIDRQTRDVERLEIVQGSAIRDEMESVLMQLWDDPARVATALQLLDAAAISASRRTGIDPAEFYDDLIFRVRTGEVPESALVQAGAEGSLSPDGRAVEVTDPDPGSTGEGAVPGRGVVPGEPELLAQELRAALGRNLEGLPGGITVPGLGRLEFGSNRDAQEIADRYMLDAGLAYRPPRTYAKVDPERAGRIAEEYDRMPHAPDDPEVAAAYQAMVEETLAQYRSIEEAGYEFEFMPEGVDPYGLSPRLAMLDLLLNKHLYVFPTDEGFGTINEISDNPLLADSGVKWGDRTVTHNDLFRGVHDFFGHFKEGVGFRADGEENAWRSHSAMYSTRARQAMTSETRGQNSWVNYGPHGETNRTARTEETVFADQKTGILPGWVIREGAGDQDVPLHGAPDPSSYGWSDAKIVRLTEADWPHDEPHVPPTFADARTPAMHWRDEKLFVIGVPGWTHGDIHEAMQRRGGPGSFGIEHAWHSGDPSVDVPPRWNVQDDSMFNRFFEMDDDDLVEAADDPSYQGLLPGRDAYLDEVTPILQAAMNGPLYRGTQLIREEGQQFRQWDYPRFYDTEPRPPRGGALVRADGTEIILGSDADLTTVVHEAAHAMLPEGLGWVAEFDPEWAESVAAVLRMDGETVTPESQEIFAYSVEAWAALGRPTATQLRERFAHFRSESREVYGGRVRIPEEYRQAVKDALDDPDYMAWLTDLWDPLYGMTAGEGAFFISRRTPLARNPLTRLRQKSGLAKPADRIHARSGVLEEQARDVVGPVNVLENAERWTRHFEQQMNIDEIRQSGHAVPVPVVNGFYDFSSPPQGHTIFNPDGLRGWTRHENEALGRTMDDIEASVSLDDADFPQLPIELAERIHTAGLDIANRVFPTSGFPSNPVEGQLYYLPNWYKDAFVRNMGGQLLNRMVMGKGMETVTSVLKTLNALQRLRMYMAMRYVVLNVGATLTLNTLHQGLFMPFNFGRAVRTAHSYPDLHARYEAEVGSGFYEALGAGELARGAPGAAQLVERAATTVGHYVSRPEAFLRTTSIIHHLHRAGFRTHEQHIRLLDAAKEPGEAREVLNQMARWAEEDVVRFRGLPAAERDLLRAVFFVSGWLIAASRFALRYPANHPFWTTMMAQLGDDGWNEMRERIAEWTQQTKYSLEVGEGTTKQGVEFSAQTDLGQWLPFGTATDIATTFLTIGSKQAERRFLESMGAAGKAVYAVMSGESVYGTPYTMATAADDFLIANTPLDYIADVFPGQFRAFNHQRTPSKLRVDQNLSEYGLEFMFGRAYPNKYVRDEIEARWLKAQNDTGAVAARRMKEWADKVEAYHGSPPDEASVAAKVAMYDWQSQWARQRDDVQGEEQLMVLEAQIKAKIMQKYGWIPEAFVYRATSAAELHSLVETDWENTVALANEDANDQWSVPRLP